VSTGPEGWLIAERPLADEEGETKYYFSTLPADLSVERLGALAHSRWVIEQFYEDAKGECGLGDYQGRRWDGVHRHLALVMLAYSFLAIHSSIHPEGSVEEKEDLFPLRKAHHATGHP
jgi:SRSO17 transposase